MPIPIGPLAGNECKLYYQTTLAATFTISGAVLVTEAIDVAVATELGTVDTKSRASAWATKLPTLKSINLTAGYLYNSDVGDTVFNAIRAAYLAGTIWHWAVMDNVLTSPGVRGSQGPTFPGFISNFSFDQALEGAVQYNLTVEAVRTKVSGSIVDPAWLTVAAT